MFRYFAVIFFISISLIVRTSQARNIDIEDMEVAEVDENFNTHITSSVARALNPLCKNLWRCFRRDSKRYCYKVLICTT